MPVTAPDAGEDFALVADNLSSVSVRQINPDTGATLATSSGVTALKRAPLRAPAGVGFGGELGHESCRFVLLASDVSFVPRARDQITDAGAVVWDAGECRVNANATLYFVDCTRART